MFSFFTLFFYCYCRMESDYIDMINEFNNISDEWDVIRESYKKTGRSPSNKVINRIKKKLLLNQKLDRADKEHIKLQYSYYPLLFLLRIPETLKNFETNTLIQLKPVIDYYLLFKRDKLFNTYKIKINEHQVHTMFPNHYLTILYKYNNLSNWAKKLFKTLI